MAGAGSAAVSGAGTPVAGPAGRDLFAEGLLEFLRPAVQQLDSHVHAVRSEREGWGGASSRFGGGGGCGEVPGRGGARPGRGGAGKAAGRSGFAQSLGSSWGNRLFESCLSDREGRITLCRESQVELREQIDNLATGKHPCVPAILQLVSIPPLGGFVSCASRTSGRQ